MKIIKISKKNVSLILILVLFVSVFIICNKGSDNVTLDQIKEDAKVDRKQFAMYVQDESNPENYREYTEEGNMFPDGYTLNVERSECEDISGNAVPTDGVVSQTSDGKVMVISTKTVYCTFYFDKPKLFVPDKYVSDDTVLGSKEEGNDGYLIFHDGEGKYGTYEAGDYSYRFSGNNPDNYVCLDGDDNATGTCTDIKKLYRVIGWFQNEETKQYQMKLIKSEYITAEELGGNLESASLTKYTSNDFTPRANVEKAVGFYWSGDENINWNNWKSSKLNETLNNPSGIYLQSLSAYIDLIEDTKWYIGGNTYDNIAKQDSMKVAYENELGNGKLTEGSQSCADESSGTSYEFVQCREDLLYEENKKVGLMYATEYGYASAPGNWSNQLYYYDNTGNNNRGENWLYNGVTEWTLSRQAGYTYRAFVVDSGGYVLASDSFVSDNSYGVRPVLVLKSDATVKSGDGSKNSPWRINLQSS